MFKKLLFLFTATLFFYVQLFSQAGKPDRSFGVKGVATIPVWLFTNETSVFADYMVEQSDGKLLVAVRSYGNGSQHAFLYRVKPNGSIDNIFGTNGRVTLNNTGKFYDLLVDSSGKILITMATGNKYGMAITRLRKNGIVDSSFGVNGSFSSTYGYDSVAPSPRSLTLLPSGKLLGSVNYFPSDEYDSATVTIVFRLNKNGTIDNTFGVDGYSTITPDEIAFTSHNSTYNTGKTLEVLPNNKIIFELSPAVTLAELQPNGTRNLNFGANGAIKGKRATYQGNPYYEQLWDLHALPNGEFMCLGSFEEDNTDGGGFYSSNVYKFKGNGLRDSSFNGTGAVVIQPNGSFFNYPYRTENLTVQPDRKFMVTKESGLNNTQGIYRYLSTGKIDSSFGTNGSIDFADYNYPFLTQILLQSDLKIDVLANINYVQNDTGYFYIFRYTNNVAGLNSVSSETNDLISLNNKTQSSIKISPNPVQSTLHITGLKSNTKLSIVNESGKTVAETSVSSNNYDWNIQHLPVGNYFLVASQNNQLITSIKFIKQ